MMALVVVLVGPATDNAQAAPPNLDRIVRLELVPATAVVAVGVTVDYRAEAVLLDGYRVDVTKFTIFSMNPESPCTMIRRKVSCTKPGSYTVGGALTVAPFFFDTAELEVVVGPVQPPARKTLPGHDAGRPHVATPVE